LKKVYGWHWLAKEVAEYWRDTVPNVMKYPALEVAAIVRIMNAKVNHLKIKNGR
jgi:hypothetical protein